MTLPLTPTTVVYGDVENVVKRWLLGTSVAGLVERSVGVYSIFLAMPKASPIPAVTLSRVSGGPEPRKDIPEDTARVQFDCWGTSREQAALIAQTLIGELESLPRTGGHVDADTGTYLGAASVQLHRWLPDEQKDTPRYIVDALITTVT